MTPQELLYAAETEILLKIASELSKVKIGSADWKLDRLKRLGYINQYALNLISRYRDKIIFATDDTVNQAIIEEAVRIDDSVIRALGAIPKDASIAEPIKDEAMKLTFDTWQRSAKNDMNITMSYLAQASGKVYSDTVSRVTAEVLSGAETPQNALAIACREWANRGIPLLIDSSGRQWMTETYVNTVIRSNVRRATTETMFVRMNQYGTDLIEVSTHSGSRPLCEPFQGHIYSRSGKSNKYPSLASTSYGEPAGLFGINCGHVSYPYFDGISKRRNEPTENKRENDRIYKESQKQRRLEVAIRNQKREVAIFEQLGDKEALKASQAVLADREEAMHRFIQETGRTRRTNRELIYN